MTISPIMPQVVLRTPSSHLLKSLDLLALQVSDQCWCFVTRPFLADFADSVPQETHLHRDTMITAFRCRISVVPVLWPTWEVDVLERLVVLEVIRIGVHLSRCWYNVCLLFTAFAAVHTVLLEHRIDGVCYSSQRLLLLTVSFDPANVDCFVYLGHHSAIVGLIRNTSPVQRVMEVFEDCGGPAFWRRRALILDEMSESFEFSIRGLNNRICLRKVDVWILEVLQPLLSHGLIRFSATHVGDALLELGTLEGRSR